MTVNVLILGDSLTYHGPERAELPADPRLWPQVMAAELASVGITVELDLVAKLGGTMRDGWWALTKDPRCWGHVLPRADAVVIALGGMDQLPAAIPTYAREGIAYIRPGSVRRRARAVYRTVAPPMMRVTGGRLRQLPQRATDTYLARIVEAVRYWRGAVPIVLLGPSPFDSSYYPVTRGHPPAVAAARAAAARLGLDFIDVDPYVWPSLRDRSANPDGLHWSWHSHHLVGAAAAATLGASLHVSRPPAQPGTAHPAIGKDTQ